jgi:hypothetical protein
MVLQKTGEGCGNFVGYVYRINLTPNETFDSKLRGYGVSELKIADMSISPEEVAANLYNTALMNEEKSTEIGIKELDTSTCGL